MDFPNPPSGVSREASWFRKLLSACVANRIVSGVRYKVRRTTKGTALEIDFGAGGVSVSRYRFKSMSADYMICHTWNGTTEGTEDVKIAKSSKLRFSITDETVDGLAITYSSYSTSAQTRIATATGITETQIIVPRFLVDDIIFVVTTSTGVFKDVPPVEITLLDLNIDGRAWSAT